MGIVMGMKTLHFTITSDILKLIAELDEFKGHWEALRNLRPDRLQILKKVATIESVGSSTRIEGVRLTDQEVEKLLSGIGKRSFISRDEEEVVGYAETMDLVFQSFSEIPLTENHIKQLHRDLLKHSSKDMRHRGEYKKMPNHVEAYDPQGKSLGVVFETATPFDTPLRMQELVQITKQSLEEKVQHPLLIIAFFIVHFLAIHPFQDGNGRLSRILTTLLLLKEAYAYVPYSSLEHVIEENKDRYYLALRRAQSTLKTDDSQLNEWILFFLRSMKSQKDVLARKIEKEKLMDQLPQLSEKILVLVRQHGRMTNAQLCSLLGRNRNTIKVHLSRLVEEGKLTRHGKGKGTEYTTTPHSP